MFPVEEEAAVVDFTAEVDGRTIKTEVRKKEEAKAAYDKAMLVRIFFKRTFVHFVLFQCVS